MALRTGRRHFLKQTAATGALLGFGESALLGGLKPVSAAEAKLDPALVRLDPGIEPLVRLLETTPRSQLLEEVGARIQQGTGYRDVLAALLLAGVRNVQPRPSVGFKFHSVLVVNSAHLASLNSPDSDRWLPIFWALDYFKSAQARDVEEGNWTMAPVDESAVPSSRNARKMFLDAMERWDEPAADAAIASLARTSGMNDIYELFFWLGARDFRSIGHKAIYVANSYRTLQCIGWHHAEPVLRSLAYALLKHDGQNPAEHDLDADRPWRQNLALVTQIQEDWEGGSPDQDATRELLGVLYQGTPEEGSQAVAQLLNRGVSPQSIWDALFNSAGELLMRQPGIVGLHAVTTTNAMHFAYRTAAQDRTRLLVMLQNAAFLPMFREAMEGRGRVRDLAIGKIEPVDPSGSGVESLEEIFADVSGNRDQAARKALAYLESGSNANSLIQAARRLIFLKGNDAHDYKFSSAVLEDFDNVTPKFRNQFLATSMYSLTGSGARDNGLVERTRAALGV